MDHDLQIADPGHHTVSNSGTSLGAGPGRKDDLAANVGLRIVRRGENQLDFALYGPLVEVPDAIVYGMSTRSQNDIFDKVDKCRDEWKANVVDYKTFDPKRQPPNLFPFDRDWDLADAPEYLGNVAPVLAVAGHALYRAIFENSCDSGLKEISKILQSVLRRQSCCIAITSSDCFLPWGMLYTHPIEGEDFDTLGGSNWKKEGFWGYQHIVQQNPSNCILANAISVDPDDATALFSVNFDDRLARSLNLPTIDNHIKQLSKLAGPSSISRTKKRQVADGFAKNRTQLERLLYFYCHGHGSASGGLPNTKAPHLVLSDGEISAADFENWSQGAPLPTNPFIFINACQGGQMQTMFYQSFAVELLKQGAAGLVGAQIDVPAAFASAYGQEVFEKFLKRESVPVRMGPLLRSINQLMWDKHSNPLALVYSLYRGLNVFIDWKTPKSGS